MIASISKGAMRIRTSLSCQSRLVTRQAVALQAIPRCPHALSVERDGRFTQRGGVADPHSDPATNARSSSRARLAARARSRLADAAHPAGAAEPGAGAEDVVGVEGL